MIEMLYGYYMAHPEELPEESHRIMEIRNETKERAVCDYIAGMTDIYAIDRFKGIVYSESLERIRRKKCIIRKR